MTLADCDLNLWPSDMILVRNTSSCPDNQLFLNNFQILPCITKLWVGHKQVSLKSMHNLSAETLTFDLATWFATHYLVMMICHGLLKKSPCPGLGSNRGPFDLKSSTLPRRYKSRLVPQGSTSV